MQPTSFVRDTKSTGLINKDLESLVAYRRSREDRNVIASLQQDLNNVRSEMEELRQIVQQFLHNNR